ncbi:hypothetical protein S40293_00786 [Stachybotrys chartarum IBT 40293]|nr:hypothetical protein S40293_00786 [Stachybotrys chartarum IBT 40293]
MSELSETPPSSPGHPEAVADGLGPGAVPQAFLHHGLFQSSSAASGNLGARTTQSLGGQTGGAMSLEQLAAAIMQQSSHGGSMAQGRQQALPQSRLVVDGQDLGPCSAFPHLDLVQNEGIGLTYEKTPTGFKKRWVFTQELLDRYFQGVDPYVVPEAKKANSARDPFAGHDLITRLCQCTELAIEFSKHLEVEDTLALYRTSRAFNFVVKGHLLSSIRSWISYRAPDAGSTFTFKVYGSRLIPDPVGRTWSQYGGQRRDANADAVARQTPTMHYLQLVLGRDRSCSEIIAIMARNGHRMPSTMHRTLLRLWFLMELPRNIHRQRYLRSEDVWSDNDLYNAQLFFFKLSLMFNDPIYGPGSSDLLHLFMGQKGLHPLWELLMRKRFTTLLECLQLKVKYDFRRSPLHPDNAPGATVHGVPANLVGRGHYESWGRGTQHLMRPDELVPVEAVRRRLQLKKHFKYMILWGYFDWKTGENLIPTDEEMYILNEDEVLRHMDTSQHWRSKHNLKKRFDSLTEGQKKEIIDEENDDVLRAQGWCDDVDDGDSFSSITFDTLGTVDMSGVISGPGGPGSSTTDSDGFDMDMPYDPEDELSRGYMFRRLPKDYKSAVPKPEDLDGWKRYVSGALLKIIPNMEEDEVLRAQAWHRTRKRASRARDNSSWDWSRWLQNEQEASRQSNMLQNGYLPNLPDLPDVELDGLMRDVNIS